MKEYLVKPKVTCGKTIWLTYLWREYLVKQGVACGKNYWPRQEWLIERILLE